MSDRYFFLKLSREEIIKVRDGLKPILTIRGMDQLSSYRNGALMVISDYSESKKKYYFYRLNRLGREIGYTPAETKACIHHELMLNTFGTLSHNPLDSDDYDKLIMGLDALEEHMFSGENGVWPATDSGSELVHNGRSSER